MPFIVLFAKSNFTLKIILIVSGGSRRGGGPRNQNRKAPTIEELDAELDAYTKEMK